MMSAPSFSFRGWWWWQLLVACVAVAVAGRTATARVVTISNVEPRRTLDGSTLELGEGSLLRHDGLYYLYGVRYQPCPVSDQSNCYKPCGEFNMTTAVYVSPDLVSWKLGSYDVMPIQSRPGPFSSRHVTYFEPAVVFNPRTRKFVMWFMIYFKQRAVAVADSPLGPFEIVTWPNATGLPPQLANGSGTYLWQDAATQELYLKHNIIVRHNDTTTAQYVSRLSYDYLTVVETAPVAWDCQPPAHSSPPGANSHCFQEGGGMFSHDGVWYVMGGNGCCFCAVGTDSKVWRSTSGPLGPYEHVGEANPPTSPTTYTVPAQHFGIYPAGANTLLYVGMRWGSGPNKRVDFQYWYPLEITANKTVAPMRWVDSFTLEL